MCDLSEKHNLIMLSGACKLKGTGDFTAQTVKFDLSGAATAVWDGNFKVVKIGKIDLSGASNASVNVTETLGVEASGAAHVSYSGNPKVTSHVSGAASLKQR